MRRRLPGHAPGRNASRIDGLGDMFGMCDPGAKHEPLLAIGSILDALIQSGLRDVVLVYGALQLTGRKLALLDLHAGHVEHGRHAL